MKRSPPSWAILVTCAALGACSWIGDTIKSELSTYAEPTDGTLAHIRLIGSRNVKVYPNSACVSYTVPGSGYPAGPQMGGQRKRDLGMPRPATMPKHYVEITARADERITALFSFYTESSVPGIPGTGAPGTTRSAYCSWASSFVPQAGLNYEMTSIWRGADCSIKIVQLVQEASGQVQRVPVPSQPGETCPARSVE